MASKNKKQIKAIEEALAGVKRILKDTSDASARRLLVDEIILLEGRLKLLKNES